MGFLNFDYPGFNRAHISYLQLYAWLSPRSVLVTTITKWNRKYCSGSYAGIYLKTSTDISFSHRYSKKAIRKLWNLSLRFKLIDRLGAFSSCLKELCLKLHKFFSVEFIFFKSIVFSKIKDSYCFSVPGKILNTISWKIFG